MNVGLRRLGIFEFLVVVWLSAIFFMCVRIHSRLEEINMDVLSISTERINK